MQISVKSDVEKALKGMSRLHKKQMPFAAALGLTMTAKKVAKVEQRMMVRELDRPTLFTIKGVRWQGASKNDFKTGRLRSRVYLMPTQAEYLRFQIEGGTRTPKGRAIAVPTSNVKLNRYGNLAGGQGRIKRLLAKKNVFQGTIGGVAGIWQRPKRGKRSRGDSGTDRPIRLGSYWLLTKAQRNISHGLISTASVSVALEQISPRRWIRLSLGR